MLSPANRYTCSCSFPCEQQVEVPHVRALCSQYFLDITIMWFLTQM
jgi:hypothetical protein